METNNPILDGRQTLDITEIMALIPHRYPFLLIDRITEVERKKRIVALKNVSINEPFFAGHFPDYPIMPGVLIVEAMAQAGAALLLTEIPDREEKMMVLTGIERAKFRSPVVPGDQLRLQIDVLNWRPKVVRMQGRATVDGKLACEGIVVAALVPRQKAAASSPAPAQESPSAEEKLEPVIAE